MVLKELGAMGNCGCALCPRTYSRREYLSTVSHHTCQASLGLPLPVSRSACAFSSVAAAVWTKMVESSLTILAL